MVTADRFRRTQPLAFGVALASLLTLLAASPPTSPPFTISVAAAPGATTEAALVTDFENAATTAGAGASVFCYPMNEASTTGHFVNQCGSSADEDINYGTATSGFTTQNATPVLVTPNNATSVHFISQSSALDTGRLSGDTYLPAGGGWTIGVAFNAPTLGSSYSLMNTQSPSTGVGVELSLSSTGYLQLRLGNGSTAAGPTSSHAISAGTSHTVFATWTPSATGAGTEPGTATLYIDGVASGSMSVTYTDVLNNVLIVAPFQSGHGTVPYVGYMSWASILYAALSPSAIAALNANMTDGPL